MGLCLLLAAILLLSACGQKAAGTWQEQYDLGKKYMDSGSYAEAITAFSAAIQIDAKKAAAYVALADAYVADGKADKAAEVLRSAPSDVDDPAAISAKQKELSDSAGSAAAGSSSAAGSGSSSAAQTPKDGYPTTKRRDNEDGTYSILEYDQYGNRTKITFYDANDRVLSYTESTYDSAGRLQEDDAYQAGSRLAGKRLYDTSRRLIESINYPGGQGATTVKFQYTDGSSAVEVSVSDSVSGKSFSLSYAMQSPDHILDEGSLTSNASDGYKLVDITLVEYSNVKHAQEISRQTYDASGKVTADTAVPGGN
jgi:YD repeat-containing protein